jgi:hypothetical protein
MRSNQKPQEYNTVAPRTHQAPWRIDGIVSGGGGDKGCVMLGTHSVLSMVFGDV